MRAVELGVDDDTHDGFVKFRDTGGVDLVTLNLDASRRDGPCLQHLYWPDENVFRLGLHKELRKYEACLRMFANHPPSTEALVDFLERSEIPVGGLASSLRLRAKPVVVPMKPELPADPSQALTSDEVLNALKSFTTPSGIPVYELSARGPHRHGWIKELPSGIAMLLVNNSYTRKAGEPRVQVLLWPDLERLRGILHQGFGHRPGCPQPTGDELPSLHSLLAFLQHSEIELESFHAWALKHAGPVVMPATSFSVPTPARRVAQHQDDRDVERPLSLLPVRPRRLVERIHAPLQDVLASAALLRHVDEGDEAWIDFGAAHARAKFDSAHKRIDVTIAGFEDGMSIYLSADGCRVVDITADRALPISYLPLLAQAGLLDAGFAAGVKEPATRELTKPFLGSRVTQQFLDGQRQRLNMHPAWQEAVRTNAVRVTIWLPSSSQN